MKNVTITLDEETLALARVQAARQGMSVSRMIGELLQQRMREAREYDEAMRRYFAVAPVRLKRAGERYAARNALHGRADLR